jgi:glycosyltransferase involved in cell wall biosynthesis
MLEKKHILFLLDNAYTNDRRVYREATSLAKSGFKVTLICCINNETLREEFINGVRVIRLFDLSIFDIKNKKAIPNFVLQIEELNFDFQLIHANDQTMLEIGTRLKKNNKKRILIYDSHELFSSWPLNVSNYNSFSIFLKSYIVRKLQIRREKRNSKWIDYLITVNVSLADYLRKYFKLSNPALSLRNIPEKVEKTNQKHNILRDKFNIPDTSKILVFIGANIYAKTLNLEQVLDEFSNKKDIALVFICGLNINSKPIQDLVIREEMKNVFFHDKIPPKDIPAYLSSADIGLVPTWNKKDLSYWYALDNKLFEYIQAGIPILATTQPEYKLIVEENKCGICVNPDVKNAYLNGFYQILDNYTMFQQNTIACAEHLNWENEEQKLIDFYNNIIKQNE